MRRLLLIRHAPTQWNSARRIQGRSDIPLGSEGRAQAARRTVPHDFAGAAVVCSPLRRALETARLMGLGPMGLGPVTTEPSLVEMDWGAWEGRTLASLRDELGEAMSRNESLGLDFRPAGGESPREVQVRLRTWLRRLGPLGEPLVAVTHKGVIRAMLALAEDWNMRASPPVKLRWDRGHEFRIGSRGDLRLTRPNLCLGEAEEEGECTVPQTN